ncbi:MAG: hypothetical protein AB1461_04130 [Thermodesulfobacteriota bacterium]
MKQLLWILLFGKIILLTESPVNIGDNEWVMLDLAKNLKAVNGGAALFIQLPVDDYRIVRLKGADDAFKELEEAFPDGSIEAVLRTTHGKELYFSNISFTISDFSFSKEDSVRIKLAYNGPVPTDVVFDSIKMKSLQTINNAKVFWKNFSQ